MNKQPQPRPDHIPAPPEGYDYWGKGPIPHSSPSLHPGIAAYTDDCWDTSGWRGLLKQTHYAICRGTELHRLNFGAPEKHAEPLLNFAEYSETMAREIRNLIEDRDELKRSQENQAKMIRAQLNRIRERNAHIQKLESENNRLRHKVVYLKLANDLLTPDES
jgi:hypothetical protein